MTTKNKIKHIVELIRNDHRQEAIEVLRSIASPKESLVIQNQFASLGKKISAKLTTDLPIIKIAFLANATLDHWVDSLKFWLLLEGYKLEPYIAPIGTWQQEVLNTNSYLYSFNPDITWFFLHQVDFNIGNGSLRNNEIAEKVINQTIKDITDKVALLSNNNSSTVIVNNIVPAAERIFGNYEGTSNTSPAALIRRFNLALPASLPKGATLFDIEHIASSVGLDNWHDKRLWLHSKHPFSFNVQALVAFSAARLISAIKGKAKKCLVLDLDNTLWGGIIGDDGINGIKVGPNNGAIGEAFSDFQTWLKALSDRGIALAVCSKNELNLAQEPFSKKEGMVLELSDFASFKANWDNKADNIKQITKEINLGLDSLVFIDDNPAERELIRRTIPQVAVPELPSDPSGYIKAIDQGKWFETVGITEEDNVRVKSYQQNLERNKAQSSTADLPTYLKNLKMVATWKEVDTDTLVRATQLINKTNQFNMTTSRYTEAQVLDFIKSDNHWVGCFSLSDHFGDLGIISIVILEFINNKAIIDTWVMSCRVFSRGMEDFIFEKLYALTKNKDMQKLVGKYIPSPKNKVIKNLYSRLGGKMMNNDSQDTFQWVFNLNKAIQTNEIFIRDKQESA